MMNLQELKNNTLNKRDTKRKIKEIFSCPLIQLIVELDLRFEILPNENKMRDIIFNHYTKNVTNIYKDDKCINIIKILIDNLNTCDIRFGYFAVVIG